MPGISQDVAASFDAFVRSHARALFGTAYLMCADADAAEELVQDTLVALLPKWSTVMNARSPLAYVRRSVVHRFVDARRGPRGRTFSVWRVPDAAHAPDIAGDAANQDTLMRLLAGLPERQRAAVVLRFLYGWEDVLIAETIGCRPASIRSMTRRGLAALRATAAAQAALSEASHAPLPEPATPEF